MLAGSAALDPHARAGALRALGALAALAMTLPRLPLAACLPQAPGARHHGRLKRMAACRIEAQAGQCGPCARGARREQGDYVSAGCMGGCVGGHWPCALPRVPRAEHACAQQGPRRAERKQARLALAVASRWLAPRSSSARAPAGGALSPAVRAAMVEPWRPAAAAADPERFAAAAALLGAALAAHPSLTDALLFPAALAAPADASAEVPARCTRSHVGPEYCIPVSLRSVEYAVGAGARDVLRVSSPRHPLCSAALAAPLKPELQAALQRAACKASPQPAAARTRAKRARGSAPRGS